MESTRTGENIVRLKLKHITLVLAQVLSAISLPYLVRDFPSAGQDQGCILRGCV